MTAFTSELMTDPFSVDDTSEDIAPLINFATGVVMPTDDAAQLLKAYELGKLQMITFVPLLNKGSTPTKRNFGIPYLI